ncbi:MAG: hypothetical protein V7L31_15200 [Nostoc sp.]
MLLFKVLLPLELWFSSKGRLVYTGDRASTVSSWLAKTGEHPKLSLQI